MGLSRLFSLTLGAVGLPSLDDYREAHNDRRLHARCAQHIGEVRDVVCDLNEALVEAPRTCTTRSAGEAACEGQLSGMAAARWVLKVKQGCQATQALCHTA